MSPTLAADWPPPSALPSHAGFPNPLIAFDGTPIRSATDWNAKRKPELRTLFQHYMYGDFLPKPKSLDVKIVHENKAAFDGKATLREVAITADNFEPFYLLIAIPNQRAKPVACFVGPNFGGNHLCVDDAKVRIPTAWMYDKYPGVVKNLATAEGRGKSKDTWSMELAVSRGYAVATFYNGDIQPDRPRVDEGMRKVLESKSADDHTNIMLWAWATMRCVDYLSSASEIDAKRIAVIGHSRLGKTALLAGAFDDRIALVIPNQAGCGGTGPSRHDNPKAEGVKRINTSFPHWFCANFKQFNDATAKIPFDQHSLVALCAPRPVLYTNAVKDEWANPKGQFEMLLNATPVYELLGVKGMEAKEFPPIGKLVDSRLGYWIREGVHSMGAEDWSIYLAFADQWLK
jgi:hypothetical protein